MKTYSSILCQIMIGALMSIGISAQADVDVTDSELLNKKILCAKCLVQNESNLAKNKAHFSAVKKSEDIMEGLLTLNLKGSYKNLSINFDFDSEIISPCTAIGICDADPALLTIHKRPKRLNNYTIVDNIPTNQDYLVIFLFKAPFNMPKNIFVSEGDHPDGAIGEYLQALWPATTTDTPSTDEHVMQEAPRVDPGAYVQRLSIHYALGHNALEHIEL